MQSCVNQLLINLSLCSINFLAHRQGFAHCVSVTRMNKAVLLAMGTDDSSISLYHISDNETIFLTKLTGNSTFLISKSLNYSTDREMGVLKTVCKKSEMS